MKLFGFSPLHVSTILLSAVTLVGCGGAEGPELGTVDGTVTLDGQPVSGAEVEFAPHKADGSPDGSKKSSTAVTDDAGHYELKYGADRKGTVLGRHGVRIKNAQDKKLPPAYSADDATAVAMWADVEKGSQTINIPLEKSPAPGQKTLEKKK